MNNIAISGSIPKKITYLYKETSKVLLGSAWDLSLSSNIEEAQALYTTVVDNSGDVSFSTAQGDLKYKLPIVHRGKSYDQSQFNSDELNNDPFSQIKILRGYDNGSYLGLFHNKYAIYIDPDIISDAVLNNYLQDGYLTAQYIWVVQQNTVKLIRVNSNMHQAIINYNTKRTLSKIKKKDLVIGDVYKSLGGKIGVFLGYGTTTSYELDSNFWTHYYNLTYEVDLNFSKKKKLNKVAVFYTNSLVMKNGIDIEQYYYLDLSKTHSYIEKIGSIVVPSNIIEDIRQHYLNVIKNKVATFIEEDSKNTQTRFGRSLKHHLKGSISEYSRLINLYPYKGKSVEPFDVNKILLFS